MATPELRMRIYQPVLFVGLGGTGCLIGAELERRLREELCGPDGANLIDQIHDEDLERFQLPACLQFVYADLNEVELGRLRRRTGLTEEHMAAAERTSRIARNLVPQHNTYPELALSLRLNVRDHVLPWLPPSAGEPRVAPLTRGAGQLPTVGRAALYETIRTGLAPAQEPIRQAIGAISKSGGALDALGGKMRDSCDVFVAFSVAGGTGAGVFYDYLHLIGHAFRRSDLRAQIYPLVVMPSAFDEGLGGGRRAVLNAGRALLDLFRLVDDQNAQAPASDLQDIGTTGQLAVHYPTEAEIRLRSGTVQTAFLFSRPPGLEREDLHRSVASLVLSLVGTDRKTDDEQATVATTERTYQSFADEFINREVEREAPAATGVGRRGVSTSLVASMTVPVDELADIVSSRLLADAVDELSVPPAGGAERNSTLIREFLVAANLGDLLSRAPMEFAEPLPVNGATAIAAALRTRAETMEDSLNALESSLRERVPDLARRFDHRRGITELLGEVDLFRLHRVVVGERTLPTKTDKAGVVGVLEERRAEPPRPNGLSSAAPQPAGIKDRWAGAKRAKWTDDAVQEVLTLQNEWYDWRTRQAWHTAWANQLMAWDRRREQLRRQVTEICDAFVAHAQQEATRFEHRTRDLCRPRTGVTYLLPPEGNIELFYRTVVARFVSRYRERLGATATQGDIVKELVGAGGWRAAFDLATHERSPSAAVAVVRDRIKQRVKELFAHYDDDDDQPVLPPLARLLARAAGRAAAGSARDEDLQQLRQKLAGMVPAGFTPQGSGRLKILVGYPAPSEDPDVERYLRDLLNLPREPNAVPEFRATSTESVVVALFRTSMGVTEVPELRQVLHAWSAALDEAEPEDYLRWRQRLAYDYGWLLTTEEDRVRILHRLLCAMWNDQLVAHGDPTSPDRVTVQLAPDSARMTLHLHPFERSSSWGSLLRSYEEWTLDDDQQFRRDFARELMRSLPAGIRHTPRPPSELYRRFIAKTAPEQAQLLSERMPGMAPASLAWAKEIHGMWTQTLEAARRQEFDVTRVAASCLLDLERDYGLGDMNGTAEFFGPTGPETPADRPDEE
jgi:hypothetical protein